MKTLPERLVFAMNSKNPHVKGVALAKATKVSPTSVSDWISGKSKSMSAINLIEASAFLGVNPRWLATGKGQMVDTESNISSINTSQVPLISWVQAGNWTNSEPDLSHSEMYHCSTEIGINGYALRVEGESMSPRYLNGDIIFVDPDITPDVHKRVIAICGSGATFKELVSENGQLYLKALNEDWKPKYMAVEPDCSIIGVVVGMYRPE